MKLNPDDIQHLANLARLELTEAEKILFGDQLTSILGYVEKLQRVNIDNIPPAYELSGQPNSTQSDVIRLSARSEAILAQAPSRRDNFIPVPSVLPQSDARPNQDLPK
jgi:aspartyl-tRNA(Asn)/glutamyl-tRNA(Gln) amidotransferase subunit C